MLILQRKIGTGSSPQPVTFGYRTIEATGVLNGIGQDSSFNTYVGGYVHGYKMYVAKYDSAGTRQWQRSLGTSGVNLVSSVSVDAAGNTYISGQSEEGGVGTHDIVFAKYNSSGVIQFQKAIGSAGVSSDRGDINTDVNGNIYVSGRVNGAFIAKFNSSGVEQWQRYNSGSSTSSDGIHPTTNGVFVTFYKPSSAGLTKFDTDGNVVWEYTYRASAGSLSTPHDVIEDSSGNIYLLMAYINGSGKRNIVLVKLNSLGDIQWDREYGVADNETGYSDSLALDSSENIYVAGAITSGSIGGRDGFILKYDPSGTLLWQRQVGHSGIDSIASIHVDDTSNVYVGGFGTSTNELMIVKIPPIYTPPLTQGALSLVATAVPEIDSSVTRNASTPAWVSSSFTIQDAGISEQAATYTEDTTNW